MVYEWGEAARDEISEQNIKDFIDRVSVGIAMDYVYFHRRGGRERAQNHVRGGGGTPRMLRSAIACGSWVGNVQGTAARSWRIMQLGSAMVGQSNVSWERGWGAGSGGLGRRCGQTAALILAGIIGADFRPCAAASVPAPNQEFKQFEQSQHRREVVEISD